MSSQTFNSLKAAETCRSVETELCAVAVNKSASNVHIHRSNFPPKVALITARNIYIFWKNKILIIRMTRTFHHRFSASSFHLLRNRSFSLFTQSLQTRRAFPPSQHLISLSQPPSVSQNFLSNSEIQGRSNMTRTICV